MGSGTSTANPDSVFGRIHAQIPIRNHSANPSQRQIKGAGAVNHKNRVPAPLAEAWALETMREILQTPGLIEHAIEQTRANSEVELQPRQEAMALNRAALQENQAKVEVMMEATSSGQATGGLFQMLNEKAAYLKIEREQLYREQRHLKEALLPLEERFDAGLFRQSFMNFAQMAAQVAAEELQKLMRLFVRKIEWMPDGEHRAHYYLPRGSKVASKAMPKPAPVKAKQPMSEGFPQSMDWFATNVRSDGPGHSYFEPVVFGININPDGVPRLETAAIYRIA